jgi:hypothetical protein
VALLTEVFFRSAVQVWQVQQTVQIQVRSGTASEVRVRTTTQVSVSSAGVFVQVGQKGKPQGPRGWKTSQEESQRCVGPVWIIIF